MGIKSIKDYPLLLLAGASSTSTATREALRRLEAAAAQAEEIERLRGLLHETMETAKNNESVYLSMELANKIQAALATDTTPNP